MREDSQRETKRLQEDRKTTNMEDCKTRNKKAEEESNWRERARNDGRGGMRTS